MVKPGQVDEEAVLIEFEEVGDEAGEHEEGDDEEEKEIHQGIFLLVHVGTVRLGGGGGRRGGEGGRG